MPRELIRSRADQRLVLYHRLRWTGRELALQNPLWAKQPIVFLQRKRFICQMLHEYIGYYYNYANLAGGGVYVLDRPGYSFALTRSGGWPVAAWGLRHTLAVVRWRDRVLRFCGSARHRASAQVGN